MSFSRYVAQRLTDLLTHHRVVIVFDPQRRYREICLSLAGGECTVVDGSDKTTLDIRAEAAPAWMAIRGSATRTLLIYRTAEPVTDERQLPGDPLASFAALGTVFPDLRRSGDSYRDLAVAAYPDRTDDVDQLFRAGEPTPASLDALASGDSWPALNAVTGSQGAVDILVELARSDRDALERVVADGAGREELGRFLAASLEMDGGAGVAGSAAAGAFREELWKRLLISEFLLDLPEDPPAALASVPHTSAARQQVVYRTCDRLRSTIPDEYVDRAEALVAAMDLETAGRGITAYGEIDTFSFENAAALRTAISGVARGDTAGVTEILKRAERSIWYRNAGTMQPPWTIIRTALELVGRIENARVPSGGSAGGDLVSWYLKDGVPVDAAYRAFIFAAGTRDDDEPWSADFDSLVEEISRRYRDWADAAQHALIARVERDGWPLSGLPRQSETYRTAVEPLLDAGQRVAYFLVDALRYDLAMALRDKLGTAFQIELRSAGALLPSKTRLGMAALAPDDGKRLAVTVDGGEWSVHLGERSLNTAADRDSWYQEYKGDQVAITRLDQWNKKGKKQEVPDSVRLMVIRTTDIDNLGETGSEAIFRAALEGLITDLTRGIKRAFDRGFSHVVVATDHGFLYLPHRQPGDEITPPSGGQFIKQPRYTIGAVDPAEHLLCMEEPELGYRLASGRVALPRTLGTFGKPGFYVHGGLSLQEALIPVMTVTRNEQPAAPAQLPVAITYKGQKTGVVRVLRPSIKVAVGGEEPAGALGFDESWANRKARIRLKITNAAGEAVGTVAANDYLDADTGALEIPDGTIATIPINITDGTEGAITVAAINADTDTTWETISLTLDVLD
ncbi:MAG: PglZ domain-containing protein [Alkalispirochaeta sp.]